MAKPLQIPETRKRRNNAVSRFGSDVILDLATATCGSKIGLSVYLTGMDYTMDELMSSLVDLKLRELEQPNGFSLREIIWSERPMLVRNLSSTFDVDMSSFGHPDIFSQRNYGNLWFILRWFGENIGIQECREEILPYTG